MSVTLGLMAASAAYSAYNNYKASEANQEAMSQKIAFNNKYLEELDRRNEINEKLAFSDIKRARSQTSVSAASLGQSSSDVSTLARMEEITALGMEQILRDRQEASWERTAAQYNNDAMVGQLESEKKAQTTQLFGDILGGSMQASKYYDSGLPKGAK